MRIGILFALGCTSGATLGVDVRTDYEPGREFIGVTTEVAGMEETIVATEGLDFFGGQRVAERDLAPGSYEVRVSLLNADGSVRATRLALVELDESMVVTMILARSCEGVECPGEFDPAANTECHGGFCVDPSCVEDCRDECITDSDCADRPHADCATPVCSGGVCLLRGDASRCGPGLACDVELGCLSMPDAGMSDAGMSDAGMSDAGMSDAGGIDAGMSDAGRFDAGRMGCTGECTPGATDSSSQGCGNCGSQPISRTCRSDCTWGGWSATGGCGGEGECSPGATDSTSMGCGMCGGTTSCSRSCSGSCSWGGFSCGGCSEAPTCTDAFGGTVCSGSGGIGPCGCPAGFGRNATCSSGSWTGCTGACLG